MMLSSFRVLSALVPSFALVFFFYVPTYASSEKVFRKIISVNGAVAKPMTFSISDLKAMPPFHINNVSLLKERRNKGQHEELLGVFNYEGVLLRDILEKAGMKYNRKWEPSVYVRVRGSKDEEVVFSFGEIFYSSIGRSILIAYKKNGEGLKFSKGCGELVVATDVRCGRRIPDVKEIIVERVNIELHAYEDAMSNIIRPPTTKLLLVDNRSGNKKSITLKDIEELPSVSINSAVMIGDCEGFKGVFSFTGPSLKSLLEKFGIDLSKQGYDRYVALSSEDGFSATFSFGEIFNSRLNNNIIIAIRKDGDPLGPRNGFAMSAVREDSTGGRSVKRIKRVEIF